MSFSGRESRDDFECGGINHRHAALLVGRRRVITDPQVSLVGLQTNTHWLYAGVDVADDFPCVRINDSNLIDEWHANEKLLGATLLRPIFAGTLQHHERQ